MEETLEHIFVWRWLCRGSCGDCLSVPIAWRTSCLTRAGLRGLSARDKVLCCNRRETPAGALAVEEGVMQRRGARSQRFCRSSKSDAPSFSFTDVSQPRKRVHAVAVAVAIAVAVAVAVGLLLWWPVTISAVTVAAVAVVSGAVVAVEATLQQSLWKLQWWLWSFTSKSSGTHAA
jgi:hypothetical protein